MYTRIRGVQVSIKGRERIQVHPNPGVHLTHILSLTESLNLSRANELLKSIMKELKDVSNINRESISASEVSNFLSTLSVTLNFILSFLLYIKVYYKSAYSFS